MRRQDSPRKQRRRKGRVTSHVDDCRTPPSPQVKRLSPSLSRKRLQSTPLAQGRGGTRVRGGARRTLSSSPPACSPVSAANVYEALEPHADVDMAADCHVSDVTTCRQADNKQQVRHVPSSAEFSEHAWDNFQVRQPPSAPPLLSPILLPPLLADVAVSLNQINCTISEF